MCAYTEEISRHRLNSQGVQISLLSPVTKTEDPVQRYARRLLEQGGTFLSGAHLHIF